MAKILDLAEPRRLYRYRSINSEDQLSNEIEAAKSNSLWCSNFEKLNDPMEGKYKASFRLRKHRTFSETQARIFDEKGALGISAFSETNDNSIMWAHYADQFRGLCLEYHFPRLRASLSDDIQFVRMAYTEEEYVLSARVADDANAAKRILSHKSHRWLYEREWRMFTSRADINVKLSASTVTRVYIGDRFQFDRGQELIAEFKQKKIPVHPMTIDGYRIRFGKRLEI